MITVNDEIIYRGGSRNLLKGAVPPLPSLPLTSYPLPLPSPLSVPSLLEVGLLKPASGSGERLKLPRGGRDRAPAENEFGTL